ncbi:hypothetical protein LLY42_24930 [Pseudomonas frederiksbergensis]|nr:hypothetical protein LLY42_24930 [Pseudomonas frederiksbergensis]
MSKSIGYLVVSTKICEAKGASTRFYQPISTKMDHVAGEVFQFYRRRIRAQAIAYPAATHVFNAVIEVLYFLNGRSERIVRIIQIVLLANKLERQED